MALMDRSQILAAEEQWGKSYILSNFNAGMEDACAIRNDRAVQQKNYFWSSSPKVRVAFD